MSREQGIYTEVNSHNPRKEQHRRKPENVKSKSRLHNPHSPGQSPSSIWRLISLTLGILCLLLLAAVAGLATIRAQRDRISSESARKVNVSVVTAAPIQGYEHTSQATGQQEGCHCRLCPEPWFGNGKSCYQISSEQLNWEKSRDACTSKNASLLQIDSSNELDSIQTLPMMGWIGIFRESPVKPWRWLNGSKLSLGLIQLSGVQGKGNCVVFRSKDGPFIGDCSSKFAYICKS
ncbi:natural killer cells antigen CD94-like [Tachyglossus aculeatus]|uniref:natural killer cells antigen CD94-like n=1 Tax=Tachyglossus aculeatus TaxID=9261 RepID=UPI0018F4E06A|nr:natural killer cells antigen CD94-like [Tachyglossus aculeatus]